MHSGTFESRLPDHVRGGQPAAFKAQSRQQHVCLDHLLDSGRHHVVLHIPFRVQPVFQQRLEAEPSQCHGGHGGMSAGDVLGAGPERRLGFNPGRQRVADAGHEGPYRAVGDDLGVHQHEVGIERPAIEADEVVIVVVPDGGRAGGRVVGGDGRAGHHADSAVDGHGLGHIQHLAAADAHGDVGPGITSDLSDSSPLARRRLALEFDVDHFQPSCLQGVADGLAHDLLHARIPQDQRFLAQRFQVVAQLTEHSPALNVFSRCNQYGLHFVRAPMFSADEVIRF